MDRTVAKSLQRFRSQRTRNYHRHARRDALEQGPELLQEQSNALGSNSSAIVCHPRGRRVCYCFADIRDYVEAGSRLASKAKNV